ncbi:MAG TPA: DUF58 domain-containing protein [Jiangellales bacterium]|nr:DUF58 domain-containing protein [Jiangellales bacterium]
MTARDEEQQSARPVEGWQPSWTLRRAVVLFVVCAGMTLVFGRPAIALVVLPLGVGTALALAGRHGRPNPRLGVEMPVQAEVDGPASAVISAGGLEAAELVVLRLPDGIGSPGTPYVVLAADSPDLRLTVPVDTSRWGLRDFGAAAIRVTTADGLFATSVVVAHTAPVRVLPPARTVDVPELPARSAGQVGAHRTRRPGDGSELLDVREFQPGDRVRRIDWRVSARRGVLHVRHTAIDADADLVICLDTRYDLSPDVMSWHDRSSGLGPGGSLGVAITAATTLAASYLRLGDRVGLVDLAVPYRGVRPGTGLRQLMRIRWHLAGIVPDSQLRRRRFDEGSVPPGAVVVVLSPYVDDRIDPLVGALARTHREVLAIDVLPDRLTMPTDRAELAAARLVLAERTERLAALARRGVLVTRWNPGLIGLLMRRRQRLRRPA